MGMIMAKVKIWEERLTGGILFFT